tara:strand:- start:860 stop:1114 length:255 start_codon:yes stop_codon:yes gene_type:complete
MENQTQVSNKTNKKKQPRKRFVAVDVYQSKFGPVSERAVYDVYSQRFGVALYNMKKYSFQHCVKALRNLYDPALGADNTKESIN